MQGEVPENDAIPTGLRWGSTTEPYTRPHPFSVSLRKYYHDDINDSPLSLFPNSHIAITTPTANHLQTYSLTRL